MSLPPVVVVRTPSPVRVVQSAPVVAIVQSGPVGPPGSPGAALDYEHTQSAAAGEWIVNHNLGVEPAVTVLTPGGVEMDALVVHTSLNQARIYFASAQTGRARCL